MSLPKVGKDANGLPIITGVNERKLTQEQADYSDLLKAADLITGPNGDKVRLAAQNLLKENPTASAGIIAGVAKNGMVGKSPLVDALIKLDEQTKEQRKINTKIESDRLATENFNKSWDGKIWSALKGLSRAVAVVGWTPLEVINAGFRNSQDKDASIIETLMPNLFAIVNTPEQLTLGQVAKSLVTGDNRVELGAGFFPSEEIGAGFAAREAQMKVSKKSFKVNGKTYYRPYSIIDPLASVLVGDDPDGNATRIVVMIGEIGASIATDPFFVVGKLAQGAAAARKAAEGARGQKAVRLAEEASLLENNLAELIAKTERSLKAVHGATPLKKAAKKATYKKNLAAQMKIQDELGNTNIDFDGIATFLSGAGGEHIIDALVNIDDWQTIQKISRGKLMAKESLAIAQATTREEILRALAPFIASGDVFQGSLELGTKTSRALSKITKGTSPAVVKSFRGAAASAATRLPYAREIFNIGQGISRRYNAYVPDAGGTLVHVENTDKLIEVVTNVAASMKLDKNVVKGLLDDIVKSQDGADAGFNASARLFDKIFEAQAAKGNYSTEELKKLKKATRVFQQEREKTALFWATQHAKSADIEFVAAGMKPWKIHSSHLDSELLNSFVWIPSGDEVKKFLRDASTYKSVLGNIEDALSDATGLWKKSVLVRPAYITRNIAEEQIRVLLSGHVSFFNNPLGAAAMALGRDDGAAWQKLLNEFNSMRNDAYGISFTGANRADDLAKEKMAADAIDGYMDFMGDVHFNSFGENVINKIARATGYKDIVYGNEKWWDGLASQMRILHNSEFVQQVLKTGPTQKARLKTVNYFLKGGGRKTLDRYVKLKDADTKAMLSTIDGLMAFLFNGVNKVGEEVSVLARIEELTGAGGKSSATLKKLLKDGKVQVGKTMVTIPKGQEVAQNAILNSTQINKGRKGIEDANVIFSKELKDVFDGTGNWNNVRMTVREEAVLRSSETKNVGLKLVDGFFNVSGKLEKITTMGPEWTQTYWDAVRNVVGAADAEAISRLNATAQKSLTRIRNPITGEGIGLKHPVWKQLKTADGKGPMTIDQIHTYAENVANRKTAKLFYNAGKRRLLFHQLRIAMPFAQAWEDTIRSWSRLALENPLQVYKVSKAINWLETSASSALYELTDAKDYYDPNQGFFYQDPNTNERKFFLPFAGAGINLVTKIATGGKVGFDGPFAMSATPQSFNFALGNGSVMPGFGPGVSISVAILDSLGANLGKLLPAKLEEEIYRIAFPYGTPDLKNNGIIESAFLSSNWTRVVAGVGGREIAYASSFPAIMTYLANSGDYDSEDPNDQVRLAKDTSSMARWFTIWRGITGAFMPIPFSLRPEALAKSKDGDTVLATSLFADFKLMEEASGSNKNAAYGK